MKHHYFSKACFIVLIFMTISFSLTAQLEWKTYSDVTIPIPPAEHPRLFLKTKDIDDLKKRVTHPVTKPYWDNLKKDAKSNVQIRVEVNSAEYLMTGDQQLGSQTLALALQTLQHYTWNPDKSDVSREIGRMMVTGAVAYDWCYPLLTTEQKSAFHVEFLRLANALECGYPPDMGWITGHGSEWMVFRDMLSAGVALYDEYPDMYLHVTHVIFKYAIPARDFWYSGHAFHQGTSYSETRFSSDLYPLWIYDRMGAGNVFSPEQQYVPYQWIYLRRPDLKLMAGGDGASRVPRLRSLLSASYYKDGYILGDYLLTPGSLSMDRLFQFLFTDPDLEPLPASDLPLSRYMGFPYGWMVARTGWDANTVMAEMKINSYNFNNHQHLDAGTFQIYHRGPLAIESGSYEGGYRSSHMKNYYRRTIAHNSLLIYAPGEQFRVSGEDCSNDGGQHFPNNRSEARTLSVLTDPANGYKTGEVLAHGYGPSTQTPAYSYLKGDITKAYSAKVTDLKRSFVFLNLFDNHIPAILIVFDKVVSSNPSYKKYWLLHSMEEPGINGNNTTITLNQRGWTGQMINTTLLPEPENLEITPVGGPGKEFWVFGKNYENPSINPNDLNSEVGEWRVEVSPVTPANENYFLNVMQVMDKTCNKELNVQRIDGEKVIGVKVSDRLVLFSKTSELIDEPFSISFADKGTYKILLTDIAPGTWQVKKDEELFLPAHIVKEEDGIIYFEGTKGSYTFERLL